MIVVLAGNPNVGKTTLFNALTGLSAKVSNYPGVTVEKRRGRLKIESSAADVYDLPGCYSLNARSVEEQIAFDAIAGVAGEPRPDVVVVVADATQLARSLYLLLQCQELGGRCIVALTMVDEAGPAAPDHRALAAATGCPVIPVTAHAGRGVSELVAAIGKLAGEPPPPPTWRWQPDGALATRLAAIRDHLPHPWLRDDPRANDALALWAVTSTEPRTGTPDDDELTLPESLRAVASDKTGLDLDAPIVARWQWLDREIPKLAARKPDRARSERIDRVLLARGTGFVVFTAVMALLFMALFWWAKPAMAGIEWVFDQLGNALRGPLGDGVFADFVIDGVIAGVGSVVVFLPQILLLFLFLGFLEDCGYLARVAYLMDRIMRSMDLHGRAFVPMLSGFACAVPAIMATRTMERRRDRILTMMVIPLMTCSARLPVYTLVIGALIPSSPMTQALLMVGMYLFSVVTSLVAAWVMSRTVKPLKAKRLPFLIELPPYRWPRWGAVLRMMWSKSSMFLREAGTVILACSIALWALLAFPRELPAGSPDYDALIAHAPTDDARQGLADERAALQLEHSYGGRLGKAIEPAIKPLGFDWKIGVGIVGAFAAREVFVSTMGIVNSIGDADESSKSLREALLGRYSPLTGLSLMVFFALACQCMSTLAVVRRESRSWRWPAFLFGYMTALAWVMSFLVFQVGTLLGF